MALYVQCVVVRLGLAHQLLHRVDLLDHLKTALRHGDRGRVDSGGGVEREGVRE